MQPKGKKNPSTNEVNLVSLSRTTLAEKCLLIHFSTSEPEETRLAMIKAMNATKRWKAVFPCDYFEDGNNIAMIDWFIRMLNKVSLPPNVGTTIFEEGIMIRFNTTNPNETRNSLIRALAATMRWKAYYTDDYKGDANSMILISELISVLTSATYWSTN